MSKQELLKERLVECVERMHKLLTLNAPGTIIGSEAFNILATTLACYGEEAGHALVSHIREQNLHERAVCTYGTECVNPIARPPMPICPDCEKEIGVDPESIAKFDAQCEAMQVEWDKECSACNGTGLMEGWNRRDGNDCPICRGTGVKV